MTNNEPNSDSDSQKQAEFARTYYSPGRPAMLEDGMIMIPVRGFGPSGIWDGYLKFGPDQADYQFWLWMLERWPYRSELASEDVPTLKDEYVKAGSPTTAPPILSTETDDAPGRDLMAWTFSTDFSLKEATTQTDGTIAVPVSGLRRGEEIWDNLRELGYFKLIQSERGFWSGSLEVYPNHADYQFWQWLIKRWPAHSSLSAEDIPTLKAEHIKHEA